MKLFDEYLHEFAPELDKIELSNTINDILSESIMFIDNKDLILSNIITVAESINITGRILEGLNTTSGLTDEDLSRMHEEVKAKLSEELKKDPDLSTLDEGLFSKLVGGVAGFIVGPSIGKVVANCLGIQQGIMYDFLTSRLVGAALGAAIGNSIGSKK